MEFINKLYNLSADILVPLLVILSGYFFQVWALFLGILISSYVLDFLLIPNKLNDWGGDYEEKIGIRFFVRCLILTIITVYISLSGIIFFNLRTAFNSNDKNLPGVFMNMEVFNFLASLTPLLGLYFIFNFFKNCKLNHFKNWDFKYYIKYEFQSFRSFNSLTVSIFSSGILSFLGFFLIKFFPQIIKYWWSWIFSFANCPFGL